MARRKPAALLADILPHVQHEWDQLNLAASEIAEKKADHDAGMLSRGEWSLLVERFGGHARTLYKFLFEPAPSSDDVSIRDFFDDSLAIDSIVRSPPPTLSGLCKQANKQIAHLTYTRATTPPSGWLWDVSTIADELNSTILAAVAAAGADFGNQLSSLRVPTKLFPPAPSVSINAASTIAPPVSITARTCPP